MSCLYERSESRLILALAWVKPHPHREVVSMVGGGGSRRPRCYTMIAAPHHHSCKPIALVATYLWMLLSCCDRFETKEDEFGLL